MHKLITPNNHETILAGARRHTRNLVPRELNEFFVDGNLLCTRWQAADEPMDYEWWEIGSVNDNDMQWTALRQNADGTTFQQDVRWTKVE